MWQQFRCGSHHRRKLAIGRSSLAHVVHVGKWGYQTSTTTASKFSNGFQQSAIAPAPPTPICWNFLNSYSRTTQGFFCEFLSFFMDSFVACFMSHFSLNHQVIHLFLKAGLESLAHLIQVVPKTHYEHSSIWLSNYWLKLPSFLYELESSFLFCAFFFSTPFLF